MRYDGTHMFYACADGQNVQVRKTNCIYFSFVDDVGEAIASGLENGLVTLVNCRPWGVNSLLSVDGRLYSRDLRSLFSSGSRQGRTFSAPRSLVTIYERAFAENRRIEAVRLWSETKTLKAYCFWKSSLRKIQLPATLMEIQEGAFSECRQLKSVVFNDQQGGQMGFIAELHPRKFVSDSEGVQIVRNVGEMNFPCYLEQISKFCFRGSGVESVRIPASVRAICESAFEDCAQLKRLDFAKNSALRIIKRAAFRHSGVASLDAPRGLRQIDHAAFAGCESLVQVTLNEGLRSVGSPAFGEEREGTFEGSPVQLVHLPCSMVSLYERTFRNCKKLRQIVLPQNVKMLGERCFQNSGLEELAFGEPRDDAVESECDSEDSLGSSCLRGSKLQTIGAFAFQSTPLRKFVSPAHVRWIGEGAFSDCQNLETVRLHNGLEHLGDHLEDQGQIGAFENSALREVSLPSSLQRINRRTFKSCANLASVVIGEGVTSLESECFCGTGIRSVEIPSTVERIREGAFRECQLLTDLRVPRDGRLEAIEDGAFMGTGVREFTAPDALVSLGQGAFARCRELRTVQLNPQLQLLGSTKNRKLPGVFQETQISRIEIPELVEAIPESCFEGCQSLV